MVEVSSYCGKIHTKSPLSVPEHFYHPTKEPHAQGTLPPLPPQPLMTMDLLFLCICPFWTFRPNGIVGFAVLHDQLLSWSGTLSRFAHAVARVRTSSLLWPCYSLTTLSVHLSTGICAAVALRRWLSGAWSVDRHRGITRGFVGNADAQAFLPERPLETLRSTRSLALQAWEAPPWPRRCRARRSSVCLWICSPRYRSLLHPVCGLALETEDTWWARTQKCS